MKTSPTQVGAFDDDAPQANPRPAVPRPSWGRWLLKQLIWTVGLAALGAFLFSQLGRHLFYAELLGNFRLQMLCLTAASALLCYFANHRWITWALLLVSAWNAVLLLAIFIPVSQPPPGETRLRIMSYNVYAAVSDHDVVLERIRSVDPDVLAILEFDQNWLVGLEPLQREYPYKFLGARWHGFGIGIFSKYPLANSQIHQLIKETTDTPMLVTEVQVGERSIRFASVHLLSPTNAFRLSLRNQQFDEIAQILARQPQPTIVLGDFNSTPWSPFLRDFLATTGYRDSRQGFGFQATWHKTHWPMSIPIDNAFVSPSVHVHQRYVGTGSDSDHYPIVLEISLNDTQ